MIVKVKQYLASKYFLKSKTLWFNFVGIAVVVLQIVTGSHFIVDKDWQMLLLALLNILIRAKTKEPIYFKKN